MDKGTSMSLVHPSPKHRPWWVAVRSQSTAWLWLVPLWQTELLLIPVLLACVLLEAWNHVPQDWFFIQTHSPANGYLLPVGSHFPDSLAWAQVCLFLTWTYSRHSLSFHRLKGQSIHCSSWYFDTILYHLPISVANSPYHLVFLPIYDIKKLLLSMAAHA